ncbi:DUF2835 family protein [Alkalilimnicola sp. S0819]|uniref:DUF2835 family protein n=1 Tax=Alkalilimnicola sp. S0819 TaxID=2613922 RepID=UPI0012618450|nr:DUF2835 family protein [Alkalilimnicola sp. S0819]KAB7622973.1 DUF2835 domain-containing protein [Alkalilimnicola sp. S0819]MPQ17081.1 DUF2835 family protein [Alkalilimnicola sp. S0819]
MLNEVRFGLRISAEEYLRYYRGQARDALVTATDGRKVRFPAAALRRHVTREGISGFFVLRYDNRGKFHSLEREA